MREHLNVLSQVTVLGWAGCGALAHAWVLVPLNIRSVNVAVSHGRAGQGRAGRAGRLDWSADSAGQVGRRAAKLEADSNCDGPRQTPHHSLFGPAWRL